MSKFRTFMQVVGVVGTVVGVGATIAYAYWEGKKDGADETVENLKEALEKHNEDDASGNEIVDVDLVGYEAEIAANKVTDVTLSEAFRNGTWLGEETKDMLFGTMFDVVALGLSWMASDRAVEKTKIKLRSAENDLVLAKDNLNTAVKVVGNIADSFVSCNNTLMNDVIDAGRDGKTDIYKTLNFAGDRFTPLGELLTDYHLLKRTETPAEILAKEGIVIE